MIKIRRMIGSIFILIFTLYASACSQIALPLSEGTIEVEQQEIVDGTLPSDIEIGQGEQVRQWAIEAVASSEYANPEWAAIQAIGRNDTDRCGDYQSAWATAGSDSEAWLEVKFQTPVYVTGVKIFQSFNPNQVIRVELVGALDRSIEIYNGPPVQVDQPCPYEFEIQIEKTAGRFDSVRITIDQSVLGLGWNQIDAVELVGETE